MATSSFFDDTVVFQGPSFHVDLAALDARHPIHYSRRLLIFRCASSAQRDAQLAALKSGLQALVLRCPLLGGTVVPLPPDVVRDGEEDWRTIVPGQGLELIVRDLRTEMASFAELEASQFPTLGFPYDLLVPVPYDLGNDRPYAACKVQFSAIDGGTILTYAMSHSVADGSGNNELFRILSEETRRAQEQQASRDLGDGGDSAAATTIMGLDRSALRGLTSEIPFDIKDHPAFTWNTTPPPAEASAHPFEATTPEVPVLLHVSPAQLALLKADATTPDAPPISTHDALAALMWRSVLLIRSRRPASALPASTKTSIFLPSDARRQLNLPPSYIGNAVYQLTAPLELGTLLSPSGLQQAASALRAAITAATPSLIASYMTMIKTRWVDWQFLGTATTTGFPMGTDWTSGVLYGQDWGEAFGPLVRYRYPGKIGEGGGCILPRLPDGTAEVLVSVMPGEVEALTSIEGFGKYLVEEGGN